MAETTEFRPFGCNCMERMEPCPRTNGGATEWKCVFPFCKTMKSRRIGIDEAQSIPQEYVDSFADHPVSVTEAKADRASTGGAEVWTIRDALIACLRDLDSGELPNAKSIMILVYNDTGSEVYTQNFVKIDSTAQGIGILEMSKFAMLDKGV